jgi:predicted 3-demethylubiquinone-9 3-methyltransferase (glyoxalase superfamily)
VSWQVVPIALTRMLMDSNAEKVRRVTGAFLQMKKFDVDALKRAFEGDQLVAGTSR